MGTQLKKEREWRKGKQIYKSGGQYEPLDQNRRGKCVEAT